MHSCAYYVSRNGAVVLLPGSQLLSDDRVLTTTGAFVRAGLLRAEEHHPSDSGRQLVFAGLAFAAVWLMWECISREKGRQTSRVNDGAVEQWKKEYVCARDGWRCTYCGRRITRATRHIDHSVSRYNGGSNHLNNLRAACSPCNLAKGARNARQFRVA